MPTASDAVRRPRESRRACRTRPPVRPARRPGAAARTTPCAVEPLEPRLLLDAGQPVLPVQHLPASGSSPQQLSLGRTTRLDGEGLPSEYVLDVILGAPLVDDVTVHLPWGQTTRLADFLPAGWQGESVEVEIEQPGTWTDIEVDPMGLDPDWQRDTYEYRFYYGVEATAPEAGAWWQAVEVVPLEVIVDFPAGDDWAQAVGFDGVPLPDETPQVLGPPPFAAVDTLRPTISWTPWAPAPAAGEVALWLQAVDGDDGRYQSWPGEFGVSEWTPEEDLLPDTSYEYGLRFLNRDFVSYGWLWLGRTSAIEAEGSAVIDSTPGRTADLQADLMAAFAAAVEAGGTLPGAIEMSNPGSDAVSFPWQIVFSTDATWDPSDRVVETSNDAFGPGDGMGGQGEVMIPADVPGGTYHLVLALDPENLVPELDETNNQAASAPFAVTVPANFAPVAGLDILTCDRNAAFAIPFADLLANDLDADGDPLTVVSVVATGGTHGTLEVRDDRVVYTPDVNYSGPAHFDYTVRDPGGRTSTAAVNLAVEETGGVVYVVNSLQDRYADDGLVTFGEAFQAAERNEPVTGDVLAGSGVGTDRILFDLDALRAEAGGGTPLVIADGYLTITNDLEILGPGDDLLTIDAGGWSNVIFVHGSDMDVNVVLEGLTLTGGATAHQGGGVRNEQGTVVLNDVTVSGNTSGVLGGGIYNDGGTMALTDVVIADNTIANDVGAYGGGIFNDDGAMVLTNVTIRDNTAEGDLGAQGGGIFNGGTMTVTDSTVSGNVSATASAGSYGLGGGIYNSRGKLTLTDTTVSGNRATGHYARGGGIYGDDGGGGAIALTNVTVTANAADHSGGGIFSYGALTLTNSTVSENSTDGFAGGIYSSGGTLTGVTIEGNTAGQSGGGLFNTGEMTVTDGAVRGNAGGSAGGGVYQAHAGATMAMTGVAIEDNEAQEGGGVYNGATLALAGTTIRENEASGGGSSQGGGLCNYGTVTLVDSTVSANSASSNLYAYGGGIFNHGSMTLTNVDVSENTAHAPSYSYCRGGGVFNGGQATLANVAIRGNFSAGDGGGINNSRGILELTNVVIHGNTAAGTHSYGGGIMNLFEGSVSLTNATIGGNTSAGPSGPGGGIYNESGSTVTMNNSIVATNNAPHDSDISGAFSGTANLVSVDPGFIRPASAGPYGLWGTADDDHGNLRLAAGSAAIDQGRDDLLPADALDLDGDGDVLEALPVDRDANARAYGGAVDVGAYEFQGSSSAEVVARHVFYNHSAYDRYDPSANVHDDDAIDAGKHALLPGQTASPANCTAYSRGLNGILIDVEALTALPTVGDFVLKGGTAGDPSAWAAAPDPINDPASSVRPGPGASERVTLLWADGAIQGQWLQVTVLSDAHGGGLGLAADEVFYFGNLPADADADGAVGMLDYLAVKRDLGAADLPPGAPADLDADGQVDRADLAVLADRFGTARGAGFVAPPTTAPAGEPADLSVRQAAATNEQALTPQTLAMAAAVDVLRTAAEMPAALALPVSPARPAAFARVRALSLPCLRWDHAERPDRPSLFLSAARAASSDTQRYVSAAGRLLLSEPAGRIAGPLPRRLIGPVLVDVLAAAQ